MPEISLENRSDIEALVIEYAWILDHQDWDRITELFVEDAYLRIRRQDIHGHDGLREWAAARAAKGRRRTQHQMTLLRLRPTEEPDVIEGTVALVLHVAKSGGRDTYVDLVGEYQDLYQQTEDGWRFRRRVLVPIDEV